MHLLSTLEFIKYVPVQRQCSVMERPETLTSDLGINPNLAMYLLLLTPPESQVSHP